MAMITPPCPPHHQEIVKRRYFLNVDLGQSVDPTALSVIEHCTYRHLRADGYLSKVVAQTYDVVYLQRLPLGLSYVAQVEEVGRLLQREPLANAGAELVIDNTGPGASVGDLFAFTGLHLVRVTITAGLETTCVGDGRWHVAKSALISLLDAKMHCGELRFAAELLEAGALRDELVDFQRKVSNAGRFTYQARVGRHDDLILSVAIGLWAAAGRPVQQPAAFGVYGTVPGVLTYGGSRS